MKKVNPIERFWSKVQKTDTCWLWLGYCKKTGYGIFYPESHTHIRAHRYAYEITYGPISRPLVIRHLCNNPSCVRPDHLASGTQKDNVQDTIAAGRNKLNNFNQGEEHVNAVLTKKDVREIRIKYATGLYSYSKLRKEYNVGLTTIANVILRRTWTHV